MPTVHKISRAHLTQVGVSNPPRTSKEIKLWLRRDPDYFSVGSKGIVATESSCKSDDDESITYPWTALQRVYGGDDDDTEHKNCVTESSDEHDDDNDDDDDSQQKMPSDTIGEQLDVSVAECIDGCEKGDSANIDTTETNVHADDATQHMPLDTVGEFDVPVAEIVSKPSELNGEAEQELAATSSATTKPLKQNTHIIPAASSSAISATSSADIEAWICTRCDHHNIHTKSRCKQCKGWKGGKREGLFSSSSCKSPPINRLSVNRRAGPQKSLAAKSKTSPNSKKPTPTTCCSKLVPNKSTTSHAFKTKQKDRVMEPWTCTRCGRINAVTKSRCKRCKGWKGGKRKGYCPSTKATDAPASITKRPKRTVSSIESSATTKTLKQNNPIISAPSSSAITATSSADTEAWTCTGCDHHNTHTKSRCKQCQGWKGGKREGLFSLSSCKSPPINRLSINRIADPEKSLAAKSKPSPNSKKNAPTCCSKAVPNKSTTSHSFKTKQKDRVMEPWTCTRCGRINAVTKSRCKRCKGWKGGKRKGYCSSTNAADAPASIAKRPKRTVSSIEKANADDMEEIGEASWKCIRCDHHNTHTKSRCSSCQGWKGGKREGYSTSKANDDGTEEVLETGSCQDQESQKVVRRVKKGYVGQMPSGKWQARVGYQGNQRFIGTFLTKDDALLANKIAVEIFTSSEKGSEYNISAEDITLNVEAAKGAAAEAVKKKREGVVPSVTPEPAELNPEQKASRPPKVRGRKGWTSDDLTYAPARCGRNDECTKIPYQGCQGWKRNGPTRKGTVAQRPSGKWSARVYYHSKGRTIGTFSTQEDALLANKIAIETLASSEKESSDISAEDADLNIEAAKEVAAEAVKKEREGVVPAITPEPAVKDSKLSAEQRASTPPKVGGWKSGKREGLADASASAAKLTTTTAPKELVEAWKCTRCGRTNAVTRSRCKRCKGWKWGKREGHCSSKATDAPALGGGYKRLTRNSGEENGETEADIDIGAYVEKKQSSETQMTSINNAAKYLVRKSPRLVPEKTEESIEATKQDQSEVCTKSAKKKTKPACSSGSTQVDKLAEGPIVGMRVGVRFTETDEHFGIYYGKITDVSRAPKQKKFTHRIKIKYDDGDEEETFYPDPEITLDPAEDPSIMEMTKTEVLVETWACTRCGRNNYTKSRCPSCKGWRNPCLPKKGNVRRLSSGNWQVRVGYHGSRYIGTFSTKDDAKLANETAVEIFTSLSGICAEEIESNIKVAKEAATEAVNRNHKAATPEQAAKKRKMCSVDIVSTPQKVSKN